MFQLGDLSEECSTIWETFTLLRTLIVDPTEFLSLENKLVASTLKVDLHDKKLQALTETSNELGELVQVISAEEENQTRLASQLV